MHRDHTAPPAILHVYIVTNRFPFPLPPQTLSETQRQIIPADGTFQTPRRPRVICSLPTSPNTPLRNELLRAPLCHPTRSSLSHLHSQNGLLCIPTYPQAYCTICLAMFTHRHFTIATESAFTTTQAEAISIQTHCNGCILNSVRLDSP